MVVMKGLNDNELNDFVEWTKDQPGSCSFYRVHAFTGNRWTSNKVFTMQQMLEVIEAKYKVDRLQDEKHDTSKAYMVPGSPGNICFYQHHECQLLLVIVTG
jgi:cyclic pyranopterin phosphate synthase